MAATATLNVRLPADLKKHGGQVLDRHGISVSDAVRSRYEFLEQKQQVPSFMAAAEGESVYERRRKLARSMTGIVSVPEGFDARKAREERLDERYEGLL